MKKIIKYIFHICNVFLLCLGMILGLFSKVYAASTNDNSAKYTLQVYLNYDFVDKGSEEEGEYLKFINTSGELETNTYDKVHNLKYYGTFSKNNNKLPQNEGTLNYYNIPLLEDGTLSVKKEFVPLFMDLKTTYKQTSTIKAMNPLSKEEKAAKYYKMSQIWVYQPHKNETKWEDNNKQYIDTTKLSNKDFVIYNVPVNSENQSSLLDKINFTDDINNKKLTIPGTEDKYYDNLKNYTTDNNGQKIVKASTTEDGSYTILIQKGTVIRLAYDTVKDTYEKDVNFFDYDISDSIEEYPYYETGTIDLPGRGINDDSNYTEGNGTIKYAFGNDNSGTGLGKTQYLKVCQNGSDYLYFNTYNRCNDEGLAFKLVTGLKYGVDGLPVPIWNETLKAQDIFSTKKIKGKTVYTKNEEPNNIYYSLLFNREGGTITISSVNQNIVAENGNVTSKAVVTNLNKFKNTYVDKNGNALGRTIYGNSFWPLDSAPSVGTDNHDPLFGDPYEPIEFNSDVLSEDGEIFAISDDSTNHNSYFGMSYYIDFIVKPGYIAPLNYWFYGDDDMWVFLQKIDENENPVGDAELIADIGGVHSSIGVYVNLWDWIKPIAYTDENGKKNNSQLYRLIVLYTERGASGSSAYMRIKLPIGFDSVGDPIQPEQEETPVDSPNTNTGINIVITCCIMFTALILIVIIKRQKYIKYN